MTASVTTSVGRAECACCRQKILKGQKMLLVQGYRTECRIHSNPWECKDTRFDVTDLVAAGLKVKK